MRKRKGYSAVEIVLSLAVVSGVVYSVLSYYSSEKKDRAIRENAQQIDTIFKASDAYLIGLKADGSNQDRNKISMQILKNMSALPINLGEFTKQEILVDTLPASTANQDVAVPDNNENNTLPAAPETAQETPVTPVVPVVDTVSFPDALLKHDPVVVIDNPTPAETPVAATPTNPVNTPATEPVNNDTSGGAATETRDEALSKASYFLWNDGGWDGYQISMVMYLTDGTLSVFPGNNNVNLTPFMNAGTPYLNYSNVKIYAMIEKKYSYNYDVGCTDNRYYDSCKFTSDQSYLLFTSYYAFYIPVGWTFQKAATDLTSYWVSNKLSDLKKEVNNNAESCIVPNVKTRRILGVELNNKTYVMYELATDGVLYVVSTQSTYLSCNVSSNRTITKVGDYW